MHQQYLVYSPIPGIDDALRQLVAGSIGRREFMLRAAAIGISAASAASLLAAAANAAAGTDPSDVLTAQTGEPAAGSLLDLMDQLNSARITLRAVGGQGIETNDDCHVLRLAVDDGQAAALEEVLTASGHLWNVIDPQLYYVRSLSAPETGLQAIAKAYADAAIAIGSILVGTPASEDHEGQIPVQVYPKLPEPLPSEPAPKA